jgi:hypothetical protein
MATTIPEHVHLVGSIALDTVEEVFHTAGTLLGKRLKRCPDGEPGGAAAVDQLAISAAPRQRLFADGYQPGSHPNGHVSEAALG